MELGSKSPRKDLLRCFLCSEFYEDPKTLPCLHTFCKKCLLKNIQNKTTDNPKKCPVCQETFDGDPEDIDNNVFLQNWVKFFIDRAKDLVNPICVVCKLRLQKKIPAVARCITCSCLDFLCEACSNIHTHTTSTINHQVLSLSEIKTGKYDDAMFMVRFKRTFCPKHPEQEFKFYCRPCHILTCNHCIVLGHKGHDLKSLDGLKEERLSATKKICEKLKEKLNTLSQSKYSMESKQDQLKTQRKTIESEITKKCSEAVSRIHKGRNKVIKNLDDFYLPKLKDLETVVNKMAVKCKIIKQALQYAEFVFNGANDEIILSLDELKERLENLAKGDDDECNKVLYSYSTTERLNLTLKITEPNFSLLLDNDQTFPKKIEEKSANSFQKEDNSSDFVRLSDKTTQTLEEDFGKCNGNKDGEKRKYEINIIKRPDLTAEDDKHIPYFTGVAWIDENNFVAVDAGNAKLKIYSLLSGKILKEVKISEPLAVSVWDEGIACLSKVNKLTTLTRDLRPQQIFQNVSSLFSSLPSFKQLTWIKDMTIFIQKKTAITRIPLQSTRSFIIRYACCLPNDSFAISDESWKCFHIADTHGKIFRSLCCRPGSITFDKYYNMFVACDDAYIWVYDLEGTYITKLHLDERPRSISILHDKLLAAVEHGCKICVYDITYK